MTYTPTNWKRNDVVTSALLNKIESGISANDTALDALNATKSIVNVGKMVDTLSSSNIANAINQALAINNQIYIPAGTYNFNITISTDCTIYLDKECYISTSTVTPCITASNCSIKIYGGNVFAGTNNDSREPVFWGTTHSLQAGIIFLSNCHDCVIRDLKCAWSKYVSIIRILNSTNVVVEHCSFSNFLMNAIMIQLHNENIIIRNCSFINSDKITGHDYCYAVSTGAVNLSDSFVPVEGLIYENNYVYDSEDCGLDTHGASNVIIRNNRVLQTVCAITAYNDDRRVVRPDGWTMHNILIENNYCDTDKDNESNREYPHAFIFLGGANKHIDTDSGYENNAGSYYSFCNCIVQNNYFKSPNTHQALIFLDEVSRDVLIQNNVIDCMNSARPLNPTRSINIKITNNSFLNCNRTVLFTACLGEFTNNKGARYDMTLNQPSCIIGCSGNENGTASPLIGLGQVVIDNGTPIICTSAGLRLRASRTVPNAVQIVISNGIATLDNHDYIPNLALKLNNSINAYVKDVLDMKHFILINNVDTIISDGTYSAVLMTATQKSLA